MMVWCHTPKVLIEVLISVKHRLAEFGYGYIVKGKRHCTRSGVLKHELFSC
jgi:hypothetical protein